VVNQDQAYLQDKAQVLVKLEVLLEDLVKLEQHMVNNQAQVLVAVATHQQAQP
jgi:hypothetical protein